MNRLGKGTLRIFKLLPDLSNKQGTVKKFQQKPTNKYEYKIENRDKTQLRNFV